MQSEFTCMALSHKFDQHFANQKALRWWPWVGADFELSSVPTMLLGESVYDWSPGTEACKKRYSLKDGLRITHANHALNFERDSAYVRNIERAIFQEPNPSTEKKKLLWSSVVYHNLVLDLLKDKKHRPCFAQYVEGWRETLKVSQVLNIQQCIVYGLEWPKRKALNEVLLEGGLVYVWETVTVSKSKSKARILNCIFHDGKTLKFIFIRHPSAFFSWRNWSSVLKQELEDKWLLNSVKLP